VVENDDLAQAVHWMKRINRDASRLARAVNLTGATDITGYSLLGHSTEMSKASGASLRFFMDRIPLLDGALKYARMETFPGGAFDNKEFFGANVTFNDSIEEQRRMLLFDPQTSGGLLLCVPEDSIEAFKAKAAELEQPIWEIGLVEAGSGIVVE
jgi:selenide,water dikinase